MSELPPDARALGRMNLDPTALDAAVIDLAELDPDDAETGPDGSGPGTTAPGGPGDDAGVLAERERLSRQLRETRMQLAMTQARLTALQNSATLTLGKTLVNAAKRPWPRGAQLPRDLYRMWRDRGAPGKSGGAALATALAAAQLADLKGTGGRFLASLTTPGSLSLSDPALARAGAALGAEPQRLVITGALTALACATLAPDAVVHPLLPHDADVLIEGTGADLVVIEAAALLPGSPWAYATDPAAADRGRRLARMIVMARSLGKPVALVRNVPPALLPGLGWVAEACDVVWDGGLGVQLARFNPVGTALAARPTQPLYAGDRDPREAPAVHALLDAVTAGEGDGGVLVKVMGGVSWRALPELYRGNGVFITGSAEQAREQAACGARVIGPVGSGTDKAVAAELAAARHAAPPAPDEVRARLREVFEAHATPVVLAGLARKAGLPGTLIGGRQVAVLAAVDGTAEGVAQARQLAGTLLAQRLRPAEVIIATAPASKGPIRDALAPLDDAGIRVRLADAADAPSLAALSRLAVPSKLAVPSGRALLSRLAQLASCPWVAPLDPAALVAGTYLLDLACARECAQADAVGFGSGDYEFTKWLAEPALARRELLLPGAPAPDAWGARGLRLFTITSQTGAQ